MIRLGFFYLITKVEIVAGFTVTLQAQREYPADMQCKDKFLLQSTIVPPNTDVDELPSDAVRILTCALV